MSGGGTSCSTRGPRFQGRPRRTRTPPGGDAAVLTVRSAQRRYRLSAAVSSHAAGRQRARPDPRGLSSDPVGPLPAGMKGPGAPREQPPLSPGAQAAGSASLHPYPCPHPRPHPRHTHHGERVLFRRRGAAASALRAGARPARRAFRGTPSAGPRCHRERNPVRDWIMPRQQLRASLWQ